MWKSCAEGSGCLGLRAELCFNAQAQFLSCPGLLRNLQNRSGLELRKTASTGSVSPSWFESRAPLRLLFQFELDPTSTRVPLLT